MYPTHCIDTQLHLMLVQYYEHYLLDRKKDDGCTRETRVVTRLWWALKTHINPNKKDVTRHHIDVGFYDENFTHYLLETQIKLSPLHYNSAIHICISCDMHSLYMLPDHKVLEDICMIVIKWSNHLSWYPSIF